MQIAHFVSRWSLRVASIGLLFAVPAGAAELPGDRAEADTCRTCGPAASGWQHDPMFRPRPAASFIARDTRSDRTDEPPLIEPGEAHAIRANEPELIPAQAPDSVKTDDLDSVVFAAQPDETPADRDGPPTSDGSASPTLRALSAAVRTYLHPASQAGGGSPSRAQMLATLPENSAPRMTPAELPRDGSRPVLWQPSAAESLAISLPAAAPRNSAVRGSRNVPGQEIAERRPVEQPGPLAGRPDRATSEEMVVRQSVEEQPRHLADRPQHAPTQWIVEQPVPQIIIRPSEPEAVTPREPVSAAGTAQAPLRIVNPFVVKSLPPQGKVVQTAAWAESPPPVQPPLQPPPSHEPGNPLRR